ncbi:MAG: hypothetical protein IKT68_02960 [Clostridia bacterium]|nr:hypothetical protein [Clostridia bacterium]
MKKLLISWLLLITFACVWLLPAASEVQLTYTYTPSNTAMVSGYSDSCQGSLVIPDKITTYTVTEVGQEAFKNCTTLTDVIFPTTLKPWAIVLFITVPLCNR